MISGSLDYHNLRILMKAYDEHITESEKLLARMKPIIERLSKIEIAEALINERL